MNITASPLILLLLAGSAAAQQGGYYPTVVDQPPPGVVEPYAPQSDQYPMPRNTYPVPDRRETYAPGSDYGAMGRESLSQGDSAAAEFNFEKALEVNPFDPVALNNLAVARSEQGDYYAALDLLQRAAKLAPSNPEIAANAARLRAWVQTYAMTPQQPSGVLPTAQETEKAQERGVPPPPPALWMRTPARF